MSNPPQPIEITPNWIQKNFEFLNRSIRELPDMRAVHHSERDDVVQNILANMARKKRIVTTNLDGYIAQATRNAIVNYLRKKRRVGRVALEEHDPPAPQDESPVAKARHGELLARVQQASNALSAQERVAIQHIIDGHTAISAGPLAFPELPRTTAIRRAYRAIGKVRLILETAEATRTNQPLKKRPKKAIGRPKIVRRKR